ncbi:MAG: hypothetical protein OXT65_02905, partial [Alphaproteobacteria bacterium]|nr:hypothetical protein [Alphaproteobacteria bacterium]
SKNTPGLLWAEDFLHAEPQNITIPPGGKHKVHLTLRNDLPVPGEYRSHIWITAEKAHKPAPTSGTNISTATGVSMPVFIRSGDVTAKISIDRISVHATADKEMEARFMLNRVGNQSIYGDIELVCTGGSKDTTLQTLYGIAVYTEISQRHMRVPIQLPDESDCPRIQVNFRTAIKQEGQTGAILATAETNMNWQK